MHTDRMGPPVPALTARSLHCRNSVRLQGYFPRPDEPVSTPVLDPEETSIVPCTLEPDFVGRAKQRNQGKTRSLRPRQCAKLNNVTLGTLMRTLLLPTSLSLTLAGTSVSLRTIPQPCRENFLLNISESA